MFKRSIKFLTFVVLMLLFFSCNSSKSNGGNTQDTLKQDTLKTTGQTTDNKTPVLPPEDFILDLKSKAPYIVTLKLLGSDSVYQSTRIFRGIISKVYKGKELSLNSELRFEGKSDAARMKQPSEIVVFLNRSKKPLDHLPKKDLFFYTIEDNAIFSYSVSLDSLLSIH